jgi:predicted DNA-binding WGR domain protein
MMIYLRRIDPLRNMARFYVLDLQPTLFGECAFMRNREALFAHGGGNRPQ